jgi:serine protease Do
MIARHAPGAHVKLSVLHDKRRRDVDVTLAALADDRGARPEPEPGAAPGERTSSFGLGLADEDGRVVVQRVAPDGPADGKLRPGDVIQEIDRQPVAGAGDVASKLRAAPRDRPVLLRIKRGDQSRYVAIEPGAAR